MGAWVQVEAGAGKEAFEINPGPFGPNRSFLDDGQILFVSGQ